MSIRNRKGSRRSIRASKSSVEKAKAFRLMTKLCPTEVGGGRCGQVWAYDEYVRKSARGKWRRKQVKCANGHRINTRGRKDKDIFRVSPVELSV